MKNNLAAIWNKFSAEEKREIFTEAASQWNLPPAAIEKDWWVVRTLEMVFTTEVGPHTVFKGGTSLSKAWNVIERFSEDIDLALDRKFLGFTKEMTGSQVKKLRQKSYEYISEKFFPLLQQTFKDAGFEDVELHLRPTTSNDQDPLIIEVAYTGVTNVATYLKPRVLIEMGSRSLKEPFSERQIISMAGEYFKDQSFADVPVSIPSVNPERTFLEKIFLLHEEFQQPAEKIKVDRLSRHLYDLERLMDTEYAATAFASKELYQHIVEHRRTITPLRGIDYNNHAPQKIRIIPPPHLIDDWQRDYELMQESMIYTESVSFKKLIERMNELNERIAKLKFD